MDPLTNAREKPTAVTVFLVLGAGFLALFAGVEWFPVVWVVGFAALVPLVAVLSGSDAEGDPEAEDEAERADPVERLKQRYAAGELTDAEFERLLEEQLADETGVGDGDTRSHRRREVE
jgi:uncharacterized membrane protein